MVGNYKDSAIKGWMTFSLVWLGFVEWIMFYGLYHGIKITMKCSPPFGWWQYLLAHFFPFASKSRKYKITLALVFQNPPNTFWGGVNIPPQKAPGRLGFLEFFIGDKRPKNTAYQALRVFSYDFCLASWWEGGTWLRFRIDGRNIPSPE